MVPVHSSALFSMCFLSTAWIRGWHCIFNVYQSEILKLTRTFLADVVSTAPTPRCRLKILHSSLLATLWYKSSVAEPESQKALMKRQMARGRGAWIVDIDLHAWVICLFRIDLPYFDGLFLPWSWHADTSIFYLGGGILPSQYVHRIHLSPAPPFL